MDSQWVVVHLLVPEAEGQHLVQTLGAHRAAVSAVAPHPIAPHSAATHNGSAPDDCERFGRVVVDPAARVVRRDGRAVPVSPKMLDLLLMLIRRRGAAVSRAQLLAEVWGGRAGLGPRTVDTHVMELRKRIEDDPAAPRHIVTVSKVGYRFES